MIKNRKGVETVVDFCYRELRLKCGGTPRFDSKGNRQV